MIVLTVLSYNGTPAQGPSAQFDEIGGTIGRADGNQLVLPDPERTISRVHARIVFRAGGYAVVDNGSNPIAVNGMPIGAGREHPLKAGDEMQIGGYLLGVRAGASTQPAADPFEALFADDAPRGHAAPSIAPPRPAPAAAPWSAPAPAPAAKLTPGSIPVDWDPFATDAGAPAPAPGRDVLADLPQGGADSLDDLFGLGAAPLTGDPLGASAAALAAPNSASHDDVMKSLANTAQLVLPSASDHASELNTPMRLPVAESRAVPAPAPLPAGAVLSWQDPSTDGHVVTLPGAQLGSAKRQPLPAEPVPITVPVPPPRAKPTPAAPLPPAAVFVAAPAAQATPMATDAAALLAALQEGLATPGLRLDALTPELMRLIGVLLRESTRGAVELLVARAALKRELRAEMTMIVARENNPLKFSPTVEVALNHLLGPTTPGFMAAAPALRDAYDDLRAHQIGVMAGMRAALDGVLQRFDPQQLEAKLTHRSALASLIPATRKARLWELFTELFGQLQTEAQDDFDELFGRAFLRAYEDQLQRLQREPGPP
ncbi:MAG: type VI secretion system-associated FHA domain protein TagH [Burkholderiales bacterium]|nr:type VI secretion system-associated FHA domain protein TagH [Burkholderiales bacterium]